MDSDDIAPRGAVGCQGQGGTGEDSGCDASAQSQGLCSLGGRVEAAVTVHLSDRHAALQAALDLTRRGLSAIPVCRPKTGGEGCVQHRGPRPCASAGKRPLVPWQKYQTNRPTESEITQWFTVWPDANLAVVTGEKSGVVVLDADTPDAIASVESEGGLDGVPSQRTGKGRH